jgi:exonuclease SbcD
MKILHTADWHIGQLFHEYDRAYEHQQFLNWLVDVIKREEVDALLISGDVFDLSNPSAASVKMFYTFLNCVTRLNPKLQIIVTAGNHDSAARLESPKPLLESSNIHIIGLMERDETGNFNYNKLTIPIKDKTGVIKAWCLAIPFLRMGDYPTIADCDNPYTEGVNAFYQQAYDYALSKRQAGQIIVAMGHLHAQQAEITDLDKIERQIMGGVECISAAAFHDDIKYVALGHIHKAQRIGGKEHIRYCGSPIPMSFSERNYKHQVVVFEIENEEVKELKTVEIPVSIAVKSVPDIHKTIAEALDALAQLPDSDGNLELAPYLEVRVLLDKPEPSLRYKIETAITGKHVRLATINVKYPVSLIDKETAPLAPDKLDELQPLDIFSRVYETTYSNPVPQEILQLFNQITQEISQTEEQ